MFETRLLDAPNLDRTGLLLLLSNQQVYIQGQEIVIQDLIRQSWERGLTWDHLVCVGLGGILGFII